MKLDKPEEEQEEEKERVEEVEGGEKNVIGLQLRHSDVRWNLLTAKQMCCLNISGLQLQGARRCVSALGGDYFP